MRIRPELVALTGVVSVLLLTSCASTTSATPATTNLHASWAGAYPSVREMVKNSDAMVIGTVGEVEHTTVDQGIPYTDYDFEVKNWVKGTPSGDTITVHQTGGPLPDGTIGVIEDDPLLVPGEHLVLFLNEYAPGKYFIAGGPTGRMQEEDGQVGAMPESIATDGLPADTDAFVKRVKAIESGSGK